MFVDLKTAPVPRILQFKETKRDKRANRCLQLAQASLEGWEFLPVHHCPPCNDQGIVTCECVSSAMNCSGKRTERSRAFHSCQRNVQLPPDHTGLKPVA